MRCPSRSATVPYRSITAPCSSCARSARQCMHMHTCMCIPCTCTSNQVATRTHDPLRAAHPSLRQVNRSLALVCILKSHTLAQQASRQHCPQANPRRAAPPHRRRTDARVASPALVRAITRVPGQGVLSGVALSRAPGDPRVQLPLLPGFARPALPAALARAQCGARPPQRRLRPTGCSRTACLASPKACAMVRVEQQYTALMSCTGLHCMRGGRRYAWGFSTAIQCVCVCRYTVCKFPYIYI